MINPQSQMQLKQEIGERMLEDREILDQLRIEIRSLRNGVRRIQPRNTTSISLVGADGGDNRLQFDPFLVQLIRVVDSSNNEYCLEAITPTTSVSALSAKQFSSDGEPITALGEMMAYLGASHLTELSYMIRSNEEDRSTSPRWVQVYRELVEWAILFSLIRKKDFGTDTLIVCDGLLRTTIFARGLFQKYLQGIEEGIALHLQKNRRKVYLVGVAKHSKVLDRYRLAMALEHVLATDYPAYAEIPRDIEQKAYIWPEYEHGDDFVGGELFLAKFGSRPRDPIWPVDIYLPQAGEAQTIFGYMLADALDGFPVPFYPQCLQKAHENAALVDFDFDILQDQIFEGIRNILQDEAPALDVFRLQDADPAQRRYQ